VGANHAQQGGEGHHVVAETGDGQEVGNQVGGHQQIGEGRQHREPDGVGGLAVEEQLEALNGGTGDGAACPAEHPTQQTLIDHGAVNDGGVDGGSGLRHGMESEVDEGLLRRMLRRAGRTVARPAVECLELLLDGQTPHTVRLTMLAALTYLLVPTDLIPDFLPIAGFSDDVVALTALLGMVRTHLTEAIRDRAQKRLDRWFS